MRFSARVFRSGLLSSSRRIGGPLVGAEVAEQHLTGLQIFLREATAGGRASGVDRASGDGGASCDCSAACDHTAGNRRHIREADAAVDVGIHVGVGVRIGVVVIIVVVIVVV